MSQDRPGDDDSPLASSLLGRVLTDPATGLPSVAYFRLIREWEERKASRRGGHVRVVRLRVVGGSERVRRTMAWRLCSEFRMSDLIASDGASQYRILLTSPDAENAELLLARVRRMTTALNDLQPAGEPMELEAEVESERVSPVKGPCEIPDRTRIDTPPRLRRVEEEGEEEEEKEEKKEE